MTSTGYNNDNVVNINYNDALMAYNLAQEYLNNADSQQDDWSRASLISMAVACLEATISTLSTRTSSLSKQEIALEIVARYRLAQTLLKYTQNHTYAEKLLSKAITLAVRSDHKALQLETELLTVSLFLQTGHRVLASNLVDKCLRQLEKNPALNHLAPSFFLLKTITDPKNASQRLAWDSTFSHDVRIATHIVEAQWYMKNQCDYRQAADLMKALQPASTTPQELHISWLLTIILSNIACGNFEECKSHVSQLHSMLDKVDWTVWRECLPLNPNSDSCKPLFIKCLRKSDAIRCTHLLSGIFYLSRGKTSLSIRFFQQGSSVAEENKTDTFLFSFYLTFAYFMSCQWHKGYQMMISILPGLPVNLAEYLCGAYFQVTGDLTRAKNHYMQVVQFHTNEKNELTQFAEINIDVIDGKYAEIQQENDGNPHLAAFSQIFSHTDEITPNHEKLSIDSETVNAQLRIILLYLIARDQTDSSAVKLAYSESAKTKNWLWTWMSGSLLHQKLIDEDKIIAAQSQLTANQELENNLTKMYRGAANQKGLAAR